MTERDWVKVSNWERPSERERINEYYEETGDTEKLMRNKDKDLPLSESNANVPVL